MALRGMNLMVHAEERSSALEWCRAKQRSPALAGLRSFQLVSVHIPTHTNLRQSPGFPVWGRVAPDSTANLFKECPRQRRGHSGSPAMCPDGGPQTGTSARPGEAIFSI